MEILSKEGFVFVGSIVLVIYWLIKFFMMLHRLRLDPILTTGPVETGATTLISIILPVRDEDIDIADCIRSIQGQTYTNWEMIIVDDRSLDRTAEIV